MSDTSPVRPYNIPRWKWDQGVPSQEQTTQETSSQQQVSQQRQQGYAVRHQPSTPLSPRPTGPQQPVETPPVPPPEKRPYIPQKTPLHILGVYTPEEYQYLQMNKYQAGRYFVTPGPRPGQVRDIVTGTEITKPSWTPEEQAGLKQMTWGESASKWFADIGKGTVGGLWYGKQTGPENIYNAPSVQYGYGPSVRNIMAQSVVSYGIGAGIGSIASITGPMLPSMKAIYHSTKYSGLTKAGLLGAKIGPAAGFGGIAAYQTYDTGKQYSEGKLTMRDIAADVFVTGAGFVGAGAGITQPKNLYRSFYKRQFNELVSRASEFNIRGGQAPEYGIFKVGRPGQLVTGSSVTLRQDAFYGKDLIKSYLWGYEGVYKPGSKPSVFLDVPKKYTTGKFLDVNTFGFSQSLNDVIPGVEKPIRTDVYKAIKYRTGEMDGLIKAGYRIEYQNIEPYFTQYVDRTPFGFQKTPFKTEQIGEGGWFAKSSGKATKGLGEISKKVTEFEKIKFNPETGEYKSTSLIKPYEENKFIDIDWLGQSSGKAEMGFERWTTPRGKLPGYTQEAGFSATAKISKAEPKATTLRGWLKNWREPGFWKPKSEKLSFSNKDFTNIKLNPKTGEYEPTTEFQDWFGKSSGKAKAIDTKPKIIHDFRLNAQKWLDDFKNIKVKEIKTKAISPAKPYKGISTGTSIGGFDFQAGQTLTPLEKAIIKSEIWQTPIFGAYPPTKTPTFGYLPPSNIYRWDTRGATQSDLSRISGETYSGLGYKSEITKLKDYGQGWKTVRGSGSMQGYITPVQRSGSKSLQDLTQYLKSGTSQKSVSALDIISMTYGKYHPPGLLFPLKKPWEGGGGETADLRNYLSRYKFREFKIPELRL